MNSVVPFSGSDSKKSMSTADALKVLAAFESGYIESESHPDVFQAGQVLKKKARIVEYPSTSEPTIKSKVRKVN